MKISRAHLEELVENSLANAAFVSQDARIFSSAGELISEDIAFFEKILEQNLSPESGINLARFVELGEVKNKYLLYVTTIQEALSLGIIQADSTHISKLRSFTLKKAD